eukprot:CAMPEP_0116887234 /NCGR_PEP_ID=MMETSP0463-20121206/21526_1 /TAXON_ID=181622 /ORGANISM="Strombidinopsis sp, Strain SopsisLIS2011" /LENGTH=113 /DNA_ID=CAMNT_0004549335 /DNA_START=62 /DNA_END=403 /DNA_ORIENTATION=+
METEALFTEHDLEDSKDDIDDDQKNKNAFEKSVVLAPFNSNDSDFDEENPKKYQMPQEIKELIAPRRQIRFSGKCREINREYEQNNNDDLDNGVYNFVNEQMEEELKDVDQSK